MLYILPCHVRQAILEYSINIYIYLNVLGIYTFNICTCAIYIYIYMYTYAYTYTYIYTSQITILMKKYSNVKDPAFYIMLYNMRYIHIPICTPYPIPHIHTLAHVYAHTREIGSFVCILKLNT